MIYLAELNEFNICIGTKTVKGMINDGKHVEITEPNFDFYVYRKYEDGVWSEEKFLPEAPQVELGRIEKLEQENELLKGAIMDLAQVLSDMMEVE